jgi:phosphoribosylanthranilate isomerase
VKVKICGVCSPADAGLAERAGAQYVGVILAQRGPRARTVAEAAAIFAGLTRAARVGVFMDQPVDEILNAVEHLELDVIQLHGAEPPAVLAQLEQQSATVIWKAVHVTRAGDLERALEVYDGVVDGILLDGERGGAGVKFDWTLAVSARATMPAGLDLIVAGGLNPENVKSVVEMLKPDVVDVASGVERAVCEKARDRIEQFVRNARA